MMKLLWLMAAMPVSTLLGQNTPAQMAQQHGWIGFPNSGPTITVHNTRPDGQTGPVLGRPFSGTEIRRTRQTLANGTQVDQNDTSAFYRDGQGRMRTESARRVLIYDPVMGYTYNLDVAAKVYQKYPIRTATGSTSIAVVGESTWVKSADERGPHMPVESVSNGSRPFHAEPVTQSVSEELSPQVVNGILAKGTRITMTIPAGTFGNDREIKVVHERWYSDALQVLLKTTNSDPRFGVTTYELTNVIQAAPDPSLFQVPADYRLQTDGHHE